uniref:Putative secreted protein n=1 Tax=Ixodes ricinus TaxID=34613 RepID=A0A6B0ULQ4_IXORI
MVAHGLQAVHTVVLGLSVGAALGHLLLATTTADTDPVDHVALLGTVAKAASLVGPGGSRGPMASVELTVVPATQTEQEPHYVGLLLAPQLLHILVGPHDVCVSTIACKISLGVQQC